MLKQKCLPKPCRFHDRRKPIIQSNGFFFQQLSYADYQELYIIHQKIVREEEEQSLEQGLFKELLSGLLKYK